MKTVTVTVALAVLLGPGCAAAAGYECPARITVQQSAFAAPNGWTNYEDQDVHPLIRVSLSEGEPTKRATLVPSSDRRKGKLAVTTWAFTASTEGYWLSCLYAGTGMGVTRKLPDGVKSCRVEADATFDPPSPTKIECQ